MRACVYKSKEVRLILFEENQNKNKQLDEMIARLDEIRKDLKESNKKRSYRKEMIYNKVCVGTPIVHKAEYSMLSKGSVVILSSSAE